MKNAKIRLINDDDDGSMKPSSGNVARLSGWLGGLYKGGPCEGGLVLMAFLFQVVVIQFERPDAQYMVRFVSDI
jgi:hypothetical protein